MKSAKILTILVVALGLTVCSARLASAVEPMGEAFTYQGHLYDANSVADGQYDFQFKLYDDPNLDPNVGFQVGENVNVPDLDVIDGYFTVELDFNEPNVFNGEARWLEIGVRPGELNDPNAYTPLSPRQEVTPTPYALYAASGPGVSAPLEVSGSSSDAIIKGTNTGNGQGMYGVHDSSGNYGYIGSISHGVFGMDDSSGNYGYIGSNSYGVYGNDDGSGNHGYLGSDTYGAYGQHDISQNYGYLGSISYGVYGKSISGYAGYFDGNTRVTGNLTVEGNFSASGIDADTLDTLDSTAFSLTGHNHDPCYVNVTGDTMSASSASQVLTVTNTGTNYAIRAIAQGTLGRGVYASAINSGDVMNYGGYFEAAGEQGRAVYGKASDSNYATNYGGYFEAAGEQGRGVYGNATGYNGVGVYGTASGGGNAKAGMFFGDVEIIGDVNIGGGYLTVAGLLTANTQVAVPNMQTVGVGTEYYVVWQSSTLKKGSVISSSERYKNDISPLEDDFDKILQANCRSFTYKENGESGIGFIAEEFDAIGLDNLVIYREGQPDGIKYRMVPLYLLEVLKNQAKLTKRLKQENEQLNQRLEALEKMIVQQQFVSAKEVNNER